jgi:hypothetical protein
MMLSSLHEVGGNLGTRRLGERLKFLLDCHLLTHSSLAQGLNERGSFDAHLLEESQSCRKFIGTLDAV